MYNNVANSLRVRPGWVLEILVAHNTPQSSVSWPWRAGDLHHVNSQFVRDKFHHVLFEGQERTITFMTATFLRSVIYIVSYDSLVKADRPTNIFNLQRLNT